MRGIAIKDLLTGTPERPLDPPESRGDGVTRCDDCRFEADECWPYIMPVAREGWPKGARIMVCAECKLQNERALA